MGINLADIVISEPRTLEDFSGKVLAIDAFNTLYQFLAIIRQPHGTPLMDHQGRGAQAAASQDIDSPLFGSPRLVKNLAISGRRKLPRKEVYVDVRPEEISLEATLSNLGITREQLVDMGLLIGTDFNEGVKGIGPKKALALIKKHGSLEPALEELGVEIGPKDEVRES